MDKNLSESVLSFFKEFSNSENIRLEVIPQSGGDRKYFRIYYRLSSETNDRTCIVAFGKNVEENDNFLRFSRFFRQQDIPVPEILKVHPDSQMYILEDVGHESLLDYVAAHGFNDTTYQMYQTALTHLVKMQTMGIYLFPLPAFDRNAVLHDLLYFKFYFVDAVLPSYDKPALLKELEALAELLTKDETKYWIYRDFQARNIMVKEGNIAFIDYQGALEGNPLYDVASLLYQAKAQLPEEWKSGLLQHYWKEFQLATGEENEIDLSSFPYVVLLRMLQTLGAYGFRGLYQQKAHFISSIKPALIQLQQYYATLDLDAFPKLKNILYQITTNQFIEKFETIKAKADTPLVVEIQSFSFIKRGYPEENSNNGGGYVFDCRGILNPGRLEEYKSLTGRDEPVKFFLEQQTKMPEFLQHIYQVVDVTVENYIERGFEHLTVNFGCTGGQHRSVYAADALAKHLRNKYNVKVEVKHLEQNFEA